MQKTLKLYNKNLDYSIRESKRAKRVRISVGCDGAVIVTKPNKTNLDIVEKFLLAKSEWIFDKVNWFKNFKGLSNIKNTKQEYLDNKDKALKLAQERLDYFNKYYNFKFNKITIKNQKTRWGSCSRKGNLNFNYKIALLPKEVADYIIVHELCHLKEFNHSRKFWNLVAKSVPNYLDIRKDLKNGII